jgi:hypothetical protein
MDRLRIYSASRKRASSLGVMSRAGKSNSKGAS